MGGFNAFLGAERLQVDRFTGLVGIDLLADFLGIAFVQKLRNRVVDEVRITKRGVAVDVGVTHGLDHGADCLGRTITHVGKRVALQHVQDLADDDAAGRRGRRGDDVVATVVAFDRL
ncbi:hypothetical protein AJ87_27775 [Rhizobium yanglingense]|nr:hypothetical protein AJ87_27775 [Rhizobium yanglingense]